MPVIRQYGYVSCYCLQVSSRGQRRGTNPYSRRGRTRQRRPPPRQPHRVHRCGRAEPWRRTGAPPPPAFARSQHPAWTCFRCRECRFQLQDGFHSKTYKRLPNAYAADCKLLIRQAHLGQFGTFGIDCMPRPMPPSFRKPWMPNWHWGPRGISVDALSHIGSVAYAHINFRGTYRFPVERYAARLLKAA